MISTRKLTWLVFTAILAGCTRYIEESTPPGSVPNPVPIHSAPSRSGSVPPPLPAAGERDSAPIASRQTTPSSATTQAAAPDFAAVYARMGRPRMIVFATRGYGAKLNEWRPTEQQYATAETSTTIKESGRNEKVEKRRELEQKGSIDDGAARVETKSNQVDASTTRRNNREATVDSSGRVTAGTLRPIEDAERSFTDEELSFERSFVQDLVRSGIEVVDRDVILRNAAHEHRDVDVMRHRVLSREVVEDYALANGVDILITIDLLGDSRSACIERRFVATAKSRESGVIVASVDSEAAVSRFTTTRWVGTSNGYEKQTRTETYDCNDVAVALASELREAIAVR